MWKKAGLIDNNKVADSKTDTHIVEWSRVLLDSSSYKWNGGDFKAKRKRKVWHETFKKKCVQATEVRGVEALVISVSLLSFRMSVSSFILSLSLSYP